MNRKILAGCMRSREFYDRVAKHLDMKEAIQKAVLNSIESYYKADSTVDSCDPHHICESAKKQMLNEKAFPLVEGFIQSLLEQDLHSLDNLHQFVMDTHEEMLARKISICAATPNRNKLELQQLISEYEHLSAARTEGDEYQNYDVMRLVEETGKEALYFGPKALRQRMGFGAQPGTAALIFARPEVGKSLFAIDCAADVCEQGKTVLHIENEDPAGNVVMRYVCRLSGMTEAQVRKYPQQAYDRASKNGYKNLIIANRYPGTLGDVSALVRRIRPTMTVINQLRNLHVKGDTRVNMLEAAATGLRNIGKSLNTVMLSVTQAGDSATNKHVLAMGDIDFSNCLAKGQFVRMYNGSIRLVETIRVGEQVMGMDGTARTVTKVGNGVAPLYRVTQKDGKSYEVNQAHILTLKKTTKQDWLGTKNDVIDVPLQYMLDTPSALGHLKGISVGVPYQEKELPLDPYFLGLWLSDGSKNKPQITTKDKELVEWLSEYVTSNGMTCSVALKPRDGCYYVNIKDRSLGKENKVCRALKDMNVWNNKHIPFAYRTCSEQQRLQLLAGIIDGDGYLSTRDNNNYYEIAAHKFQNDILDLCWSLGLKVSMVGKNRIYLSGSIDRIPCKLPRKQCAVASTKDVLCSKLKIESIGIGEYYGITVDGDQRYLLGNFVVTHNTGIPSQMDLIIGIGADEDMLANDLRIVSLSKNKLGSIHDSFTMGVNKSLSRTED